MFVFSNETEPDLSAADMERDNSNATQASFEKVEDALHGFL